MSQLSEIHSSDVDVILLSVLNDLPEDMTPDDDYLPPYDVSQDSFESILATPPPFDECPVSPRDISFTESEDTESMEFQRSSTHTPDRARDMVVMHFFFQYLRNHLHSRSFRRTMEPLTELPPTCNPAELFPAPM